MRRATSPPHLATLICLTALPVLSLNMFLPSLARMADEFGTGYGTMSIAVAGYLGLTAVLQLVLGPLSDRFGRRPVLLWTMGVFVLASIGCALAQNVAVFLAFRMVQGVVIAGTAISRAVVRDMVPGDRAAVLLGQMGMVMALAPMTGPLVGGLLDMAFGWRASFVAFALVGVVLWGATWADLGETHTSRSATFGDQFRSYPELFRSRRFWGYSVCVAFSVGAFYAFISGAALVGEAVFALSPAQVGIGIGSITGGFAVGNFLSSRLSARFGLTAMMIAGRVCALAGLTSGALMVTAGWLWAPAYFGSVVFVGMGNGLTLPSANAGVLSVRPHLAGSASGVSGALMVGGGGVLTYLAGVLLEPRHGALTLLLIMLFCVLASLAAALYVRHIDLTEGAPAA